MSELQYPLQSRSPGSLFRLPSELRAIIWEMIIYNPPPRVCSPSRPMGGIMWGIMGANVYLPNLMTEGNGSWGLFVYDYPLLRYICRESRQEAIYHSPAHDWQISGHKHPTRRYEPDSDIFYFGSGDFCRLFYDSSRLPTSLVIQIAPVQLQVRETRHIAVDDIKFYNLLLRVFPRLDKVSLIVGSVDMEDTFDVTYNSFSRSKGIPERPCALGSIPSLEPIRAEVPKVGTLAYVRGSWVKRAHLNAEKASFEFAVKAEIAACRLKRRGLIPQSHSLPPLEPAMILQLTRWRVDEGVEKSEKTGAYGALRCHLGFAARWLSHQLMWISGMD